MPAAGSFSLGKPSTTSTTPAGAGFTPSFGPGASTAAPTPSPFTFGGFGAPKAAATPAAAPASTPKKTSAEVTNIVKDALASVDQSINKIPADTPFGFGRSSSGTVGTPYNGDYSVPPTVKKSSQLFSITPTGPLQPSTPERKSITPSKNIEDASPAKLGKFGPGGSQPTLAFGGAGGAKTSPAAPASFGFGSSTAAPKPAAAAPSFSFGTSPSSNAAPFSFGGVSSSSTASAFTSSSQFSFKPAISTPAAGSQPLSTTASAQSAGTDAPGEGSGGAEGAEGAEGDAAAAAAEPSTDLGAAGGAGEEDEDTVLEFRTRLFALQATDGNETKKEWKTLGVGALKVKKNRVDGKRRLLMRTDGSGHVLLVSVFPLILHILDRARRGGACLGRDHEAHPRTVPARIRHVAGHALSLEDKGKLTCRTWHSPPTSPPRQAPKPSRSSGTTPKVR